MNDGPILSLVDVSKSFPSENGSLEVLHDINMNIARGDFVCILGHSGCGKSTLLRLIAGFETADSGALLLDGKVQAGPSRDAIMVFQDFNQLFPWKTIQSNIMFPMLVTKTVPSKAAARKKADELLKLIGLEAFANAYPYQLSGGMKQRAAVARALAIDPKIMLMDEPFAALDAVTRKQLRLLTRDICEKKGVTVLFVTHSVEEAVDLADRIIVVQKMSRGEYVDMDNRTLRLSSKEERLDRVKDILLLLSGLTSDQEATGDPLPEGSA